MKKIVFSIFFYLLWANVALAQGFTGIKELINGAKEIIDLLIPIVAAIALLYFFWGLAKLILHAGDEKAREEGKHIMVWGIAALFVIVSIWGIVFFIQEALLDSVPMTLPSGTFCPPGTANC